MRFKKRIPKFGEVRIVKRFLWFPLRLIYQGWAEYRWWETAHIVQYHTETWWFDKRFATQKEIANWED